MRTLARSTTLLLGLALGARLPLSADCGATTFTPAAPYVPPPQTHNAYFLTDPGGEQRAVFDLHWGGTLASLQYLGTEYAWGGATGGMVQPAMHDLIGSQDYNPTAAGDQHNFGSVTSGVRCLGPNILYLMSGGSLDYPYGASGHIVANAVRAGSVVANSYATPYYVVTIASFVKNPGGTPAYYLRVQETVTNIDPAEFIFWGFEIAGYVAGNLLTWVQSPANCTSSAPCTSSSTPALVAGLYPSGSLQGGTAFYISPKAYWRSEPAFVSFGADTQTYHNASTHLFTGQWGLAPGHSRTFVFFVLVGDWSNALAFGTSPNPPLQFFTVTPCRAVDTRVTHQTITSNSPVVFQIGSACGIPANAVSVAFNVTAVGATANVSLAVYPGDLASPPTTNVVTANTSQHSVIASNAVIPLAANGNGTVAVAATFATAGQVDVILDVNGYFLP
jgi:hypothetical protein